MQNQMNQYTAVDDDEPTYDLDGNMLTNGDWNYAWNGENRLVRAENAVTGAALEFDYDYMGRRIFKKVYHGTVLEKHLVFVYDGYKLIEERDALDGGALVRRYAWQPEVLGRDVPLTVHDAANGCTYYYHTDANKNVTEITDESGAVAAHYEYSPFGTVTHATGSFAAANPFRFSSEYSDAETGLVYYNYRYYSPELGRWLSRDPIEELGGYNLYGMLGNNPIMGWDALGYGHAWWCPQGAYSWVMTGDRNASSDILSAANEGFMEGLSDGAAGVGDGLTAIPYTDTSLTKEIRKLFDVDYIYDQKSYNLGKSGGTIARYAITATAIIKTYQIPDTLYHFTSKEAAAKIAIEGIKPTVSEGGLLPGGLFGNNVIYATRFNSAIAAKLQGAKSVETMIEISTKGKNVVRALFPGTFKIIP